MAKSTVIPETPQTRILDHQVECDVFGHVFTWDNNQGRFICNIGVDGGPVGNPKRFCPDIVAAIKVALFRGEVPVVPDYSTPGGIDAMQDEMLRRFRLHLIRRKQVSKHNRRWCVCRTNPNDEIAQDDDPRHACLKALHQLGVSTPWGGYHPPCTPASETDPASAIESPKAVSEPSPEASR